MVLLTLAYGAGRLRSGPDAEQAAPIIVAAVQGNVDLGSQWDSAFYGRTLDVYQRLSAEVLGRDRARLVVWPENAMTFFVASEPAYQAAIASVLRPWSAELIAGGVHTDGGSPPGAARRRAGCSWRRRCRRTSEPRCPRRVRR